MAEGLAREVVLRPAEGRREGCAWGWRGWEVCLGIPSSGGGDVESPDLYTRTVSPAVDLEEGGVREEGVCQDNRLRKYHFASFLFGIAVPDGAETESRRANIRLATPLRGEEMAFCRWVPENLVSGGSSEGEPRRARGQAWGAPGPEVESGRVVCQGNGSPAPSGDQKALDPPTLSRMASKVMRQVARDRAWRLAKDPAWQLSSTV